MKNPFVNAVLASLYIVLVSLFMFYGKGLAPKQDTIFMPIAMISLLTFSVAMMGYLFLSQPIQIYLEGRKEEAMKFFLKTLATFGGITLIVVSLMIFWRG